MLYHWHQLLFHNIWPFNDSSKNHKNIHLLFIHSITHTINWIGKFYTCIKICGTTCGIYICWKRVNFYFWRTGRSSTIVKDGDKIVSRQKKLDPPLIYVFIISSFLSSGGSRNHTRKPVVGPISVVVSPSPVHKPRTTSDRRDQKRFRKESLTTVKGWRVPVPSELLCFFLVLIFTERSSGSFRNSVPGIERINRLCHGLWITFQLFEF